MANVSEDEEGRLDAASTHWLDIEAKNLTRYNEQLLARLLQNSEHPSLKDRTASDMLAQNYLVLEQPLESFLLPRSTFGFLGEKLLADWATIASHVIEIHNRIAGLHRIQASLVLSGDPAIEDIRKRLMTWADECVSARLSKIAFKKGGAKRQFETIYRELLPELDKIVFRKGTANFIFYSQIANYLAARIFDCTFGSMLKYTFNRDKLLPEFEVVCDDEHLVAYVSNAVTLHQWQHSHDVANVLSIVAGSLTDEQKAMSNDQVRARLRLLITDIEEMRPYLRNNFNSENIVLEVAPGVFISYLWAVGLGVAIIPVGTSKKELIEDLRAGRTGLALTLQHQGILSSYATPWIDADSALLREPHALHANLSMVEALHAKLYRFYEKIDIDAILARFHKRVKDEAVTEEPSDEEFAALCRAIAEPIVDSEAPGLTAPLSMKAVRVQRLLSILADKLACEVRQGKGSEIVVYREGGHHFRLGHHKRNSYVATPVIKNLLKHVGVSFDEWLGTIT